MTQAPPKRGPVLRLRTERQLGSGSAPVALERDVTWRSRLTVAHIWARFQALLRTVIHFSPRRMRTALLVRIAGVLRKGRAAVWPVQGPGPQP